MEMMFTLFFIAADATSDLDHSCETLINFYALWEDSGFGWEPNGIERAAWILRYHDRYILRVWRNSAARNKQSWKGPAPDNLAGMVHTHPNRIDPRPSRADVLMANNLHIPVYVISRNGIWISEPNGKISRLKKYIDFKESIQTCSKKLGSNRILSGNK